MTQRVVNYTYGTGNPVLPDGSIDVRDGIDNLQSFDIFMNADEDTYNQRDGGIVKTRAGAVRAVGIQRIGDFTTGCTVTERNQGVLYETDGTVYVWLGALPKVVPPASSPAATGGISPTGNWLDVGDASAYSRIVSELSAPDGAALVGGVSQVFDTVTDMKAFNVIAGRIYATNGFYTSGDGGGTTYLAESAGTTPDGYGDHAASNGVFLRLQSTPTDLNHGVKIGDTFVAADAWNNRNALQAMMRNLRFGYVELVVVGTYYVLGSINVGRDDLTVHHKAGCKIIGRYDDASIPASLTSQAGGVVNFTKYADPDNGVFHPVTEYTERVNYVLDGDFSTEYNAGHNGGLTTHNNNCISFYKVKDCAAKGLGGISGSDHRGINFDGGAINCHIDIAYAMGTMDEPLVMKSDTVVGNKCTVRVGRIDSVPFGGPNPWIAVRLDGGYSIDVEIGSFMWDGVTKPQLVGAFNCNSVNVRAGYVNGASQLLRQYETLISDVSVAHLRNTPWGIVRAGLAANAMRSAKLHGIKSIDSAFLYPYRAENNDGTFRILEICDNDFTGGPVGFQYYNGRTAPGFPDVYDLHDNFSPAGFTPTDFNPRTFGISGNLATGSSSVTVNYKSPDWIYGKLSIVVASGGNNYGVEIDLRTRDLSSSIIGYYVGPTSITTTKTGGSLSISCANGTFILATLHN